MNSKRFGSPGGVGEIGEVMTSAEKGGTIRLRQIRDIKLN